MEDHFSPIVYHESLTPKYEICPSGAIRNIRTKRVLKSYLNPSGERVVSLRGKGYRNVYLVKKLMAANFLGFGSTKYPEDIWEIDYVYDPTGGETSLDNLRLVDRFTFAQKKLDNDKTRKRKYFGVHAIKVGANTGGKIMYTTFINHWGKRLTIGTFNTELKALKAYTSMTKKIVREGKYPNFNEYSKQSKSK